MTATAAVQQLRWNTMKRAFDTYFRWVGQSIGWATVLWLLFWGVVYLVSGLQILKPQPLAVPLEQLRLAISVIVVLGFGLAAFRTNVPPVLLNRRDLMRLAIAPLEPKLVLQWGFWLARGQMFFGAVVVALIWLTATWFFFGQPQFLVFLIVPLYQLALLEWRWLGYTNAAWRWWLLPILAVAIALEVLGIPVISGAFFGTALESIVLPIILLVLGTVINARNWQQNLPPLFATHSLILSQIRALQQNAIVLRSLPDTSEMRRWKQALHRKKTRASRSIVAPKAFSPFAALAWRNALNLYRQTWLEQLVLLLTFVFAFVVNTDFIASSILGIVQIIALRSLATPLLMPEMLGLPVPIPTRERTLGRALIGTVLISSIGLFGLLFSAILPIISVEQVLISTTRLLLALFILEKLSATLRLPVSRVESGFGAAILAVLPSTLLYSVGLQTWLFPVQIFVLVMLMM